MIFENAQVLLHAYIDGELDAASTIELEKEIERSPALRQELARLSALQGVLRAGAVRFEAPDGLTDRVFESVSAPRAKLRGKEGSFRRRALAISGVVAAALLAWILGPALFNTQRNVNAVDEVVSAHIRSLMADHLTDLASAERHDVKPWLSTRLDFAPPVRDFSSHGFHLVGARLDYLGRRAVAALIYRHRQHVINVFVWPSAAETSTTSLMEAVERGYNTVRFHSGAMSYSLVSDVNPNDLRKLAGLLSSDS
jgi:anti-sigma factor RsiW